MKANDTSVLDATKALNQISPRFNGRDAVQLLSLFWFYRDNQKDGEYECAYEIPFMYAVQNLRDNLTRRPEFWGVGTELGASCEEVDAARDSLALAALSFLLKNGIVFIDTDTGNLKLNFRNVDFDAFDAARMAEGLPPCGLTRAQCLLVEEAEELTTGAVLTARLNQRGIDEARKDLEAMKAKYEADPNYCRNVEIWQLESLIEKEAQAANDEAYRVQAHG